MAHEVVEQEMDRCDLLDVLEEAAMSGGTVDLRTRDGTTWRDAVEDVVTEDGRDFAVLAEHGRVAVDDLQRVSRAVPPRRR